MVSPWVLLIALVACGSDSPTEPTGPSAAPPVASVTVLPTPVVFLVGTTAQLTASVKDSLGRALADRTVIWSSSAPSIATVDSTGLVTGVAPGSVTITATSEGKSGMAAVTVDAVDSLTVWMLPDTLARGDSRPLVARAVGVSGFLVHGVRAIWSSSDTAVATIDTSGFLRAVGGGSATITATFEGESGTADVTVLVINFASVDAGTFSTCGLSPSGTAYCWGGNPSGLLGVSSSEMCPGFSSGEFPCTTRPLPVSGDIAFATLSVANGFVCGLDTGGAAYCWGWNGDGRLGDGTTTNRTTPVPVSGGLIFASLSAGGSHACGLTAVGDAYCWGANDSWQLGTNNAKDTCQNSSGVLNPCSTVPVAVSGVLTFATLHTGDAAWHTCGLTTSGEAYCWGRNEDGQLGDGTTTNRATPVPVAGGLTFASLSAGGVWTCGVTVAGQTYCWGENDWGLGNGTTNSSPTPVAVSGGLAFASVSTGSYHSCAITTGGVAYCWGNNFSAQLGDSTTVDRTEPSAVSGGHTFATISASWFHTCGFSSSAVAYCWGSNEFGQVGNGMSVEARASGEGEEPRYPVPVLGQPSANY